MSTRMKGLELKNLIEELDKNIKILTKWKLFSLVVKIMYVN